MLKFFELKCKLIYNTPWELLCRVELNFLKTGERVLGSEMGFHKEMYSGCTSLLHHEHYNFWQSFLKPFFLAGRGVEKARVNAEHVYEFMLLFYTNA